MKQSSISAKLPLCIAIYSMFVLCTLYTASIHTPSNTSQPLPTHPNSSQTFPLGQWCTQGALAKVLKSWRGAGTSVVGPLHYIFHFIHTPGAKSPDFIESYRTLRDTWPMCRATLAGPPVDRKQTYLGGYRYISRRI